MAHAINTPASTASHAAILAALKASFPESGERIDEIFATHAHPSPDVVLDGRHRIDAHSLARRVKTRVIGQDANVDSLAERFAAHVAAGPNRPFCVLAIGGKGSGAEHLAMSFCAEASNCVLNTSSKDGATNPGILFGAPRGFMNQGPGRLHSLLTEHDLVGLVLTGAGRELESSPLQLLLLGHATDEFAQRPIDAGRLIVFATTEAGAREAQDILRESSTAFRQLNEDESGAMSGRMIVRTGAARPEDVEASLRRLLESSGVFSPEWSEKGFHAVVALQPMGAEGAMKIVLDLVSDVLGKAGCTLAPKGLDVRATSELTSIMIGMEARGFGLADRAAKVRLLLNEAVSRSDARRSVKIEWDEERKLPRILSAEPKPVPGKAAFLALVDSMEAAAIGGGGYPTASDAVSMHFANMSHLVIRGLSAWLQDTEAAAGSDQHLVALAGRNIKGILDDPLGLGGIIAALDEKVATSRNGFSEVGLGLPAGMARVLRGIGPNERGSVISSARNLLVG